MFVLCRDSSSLIKINSFSWEMEDRESRCSLGHEKAAPNKEERFFFFLLAIFSVSAMSDVEVVGGWRRGRRSKLMLPPPKALNFRIVRLPLVIEAESEWEFAAIVEKLELLEMETAESCNDFLELGERMRKAEVDEMEILGRKVFMISVRMLQQWLKISVRALKSNCFTCIPHRSTRNDKTNIHTICSQVCVKCVQVFPPRFDVSFRRRLGS